MNFHEAQFPTALSFGSTGGPERRTDVVTLANGFEERNTPWADSRRSFDAGIGIRSLPDLEAVVSFFEERRGKLYGFRWKDWADFRSGSVADAPDAGDQSLGTGDGVTQAFQLTKVYGSGSTKYVRTIRKPVLGTVLVAVDGVPLSEGADYIVDTSIGEVTFVTAPAAGSVLTVGFEFDVPVRFDTDSISVSAAGFNAGEIPSVPVVEVRL